MCILIKVYLKTEKIEEKDQICWNGKSSNTLREKDYRLVCM